MSIWHRAHIKFQYSPKGQSIRSHSAITVQVYGNTESAAMQELRKHFPSYDNFAILEIDWQT
jgi:hypothetical protein